MKRKLFINALLLMFIINVIPITSKASNEINEASTTISTSSTDSLITPYSVDTSISFTLSSGASKTKSISCTKNSTIAIAAVLSSSSSTALLGIIDPGGTYHCASIKGSGSISYTFPSSGTYKIYCNNTSSSSYSVSLAYSID